MRIGVICPSEIALRRFMPAIQNINDLEFAGVGIYTAEERFGENLPENGILESVLRAEYSKAEMFINQYGGKIYNGYQDIVEANDVDAIYIPLPPALHFKWAKKALENGKHVLVEKPSTVSAKETRILVELAEKKGLALHENYMFAFHQQLNDIDKIIANGEIGDVRLYRISFGFPRRSSNDFRYNMLLGGGALMDVGGYTIKYAERFLGSTAKIKYAQLNYIDEFDVDIYGSAALVNDRGVTAQIAFGMDNNYKCDLEIWGSHGYLTVGRVLTAPVGFVPTAVVRCGNEEKRYNLSADDSFEKSIRYFIQCIEERDIRKKNYSILLRQVELVDEFKAVVENNG